MFIYLGLAPYSVVSSTLFELFYVGLEENSAFKNVFSKNFIVFQGYIWNSVDIMLSVYFPDSIWQWWDVAGQGWDLRRTHV